MFSSLRSRLWFTYAFSVVIALLVVAVVFVVYLLSNPLVYRQTRLRLAAVQAQMLAQQSEWSNLPQPALIGLLGARDKEFDARMLVLNPQRQIIADSRTGSAAGFDTRPFFRILRLNQTVTDVHGQPWIYNVRKLDNGNFLVIAFPRPAISFWAILTDELMPPLVWAGISGLFLALFIAFWMARWVADPLQEVVTAAQGFSGEAAQPLKVQGPREVKELVGAYNRMTSRVQTSQQAQRDFVANVSHELKTPLTSIQGFSQAILDETAATPEQQKQAAQIIFDEAGRMHRLVVTLLDLARLDSGIADLKRQPVDLKPLLDGVGDRFMLQARSIGVHLDVHSDQTSTIIGDGDRLAQVFTNLVDNAIKFTTTGGTVSLTARSVDGAVEVVVADNGVGIPAESLPRIFDRFYQADSSRQGGKKHGAGLGLAIADGIVRAHGGKITVHSVVGQGSEFIVWLPNGNANPTSINRKRK